jgi:hypothetical protein
MSKIYELAITPEYVSSWDFKDAVREILQNAIDNGSEMTVRHANNVLYISNAEGSLTIDSLLLGTTSKQNDESKIGSFGEGYKLAMLVLTRLGHTVTVEHGDVSWEPFFKESEVFGVHTLHIQETLGFQGLKGITFCIHDVTEEMYDSIAEHCLQLQASNSEANSGAIETVMGRILPNAKGQLFVNGLFVCKIGMSHGYDILPKFITLERDRKTVDVSHLQRSIYSMWLHSEQYTKMAEMLSLGERDMYYADLFNSEEVTNACFELFTSQNPGKTAVSDESSNNEVSNGVIVNCVYQSLLSRHKDFSSLGIATTKESPTEFIEKWISENGYLVKPTAILAFHELLNQSKNWK